MAVYKRSYGAYDGPLTAERWRFLVLPRYAFQEVFESRVFTSFLVLCSLPFLTEVAVVYVANNEAVRLILGMQHPPRLLGADFFLGALGVQGFLAFLMAAWLSPSLVSPDLVNGALPLYLSRPFSRSDYVLGKASVLLTLLSLVTWVPQLVVFALQAGFQGGAWLTANLRVAFAIFLGAWIWITVLTLLGLAVSAWIRWRILASGTLFGVFFVGAAFGAMWRVVLRNSWGRLVDLGYLMRVVWRDLFGASGFFASRQADDLPAWLALATLAAVCVAALLVLDRRLRAREVVS